MLPIEDIDRYTAGMHRSLPDKLWWLKKLPKGIVSVSDYGCADGSVLRYLHDNYPGLYLCGYDNSEEMLQMARRNSQAEIFSDFQLLKSRVRQWGGRAVLLASSVFHEIMAYSQDYMADFRNIFSSGYEFIAIRDMFLTAYSLSHEINPRWVSSIRERYPRERLGEYELIYGSLSQPASFLQFLLKYRYTDNWERELHENYFPYTLEEFISMLPSDYEIIYLESYTLPYLRHKVSEDFHIDLTESSHAKILLKRK